MDFLPWVLGQRIVSLPLELGKEEVSYCTRLEAGHDYCIETVALSPVSSFDPPWFARWAWFTSVGGAYLRV